MSLGEFRCASKGAWRDQAPRRSWWSAGRLKAGQSAAGALDSVCEGLSPNALRYSTENRPNSPKPKPVAISVTVARSQSADKRARLARDSRSMRRCRQGAAPCVLWNALRSVRSLTSRARQRAEMWSGSSRSARASCSARATSARQEVLDRVTGVSATLVIQPWMVIEGPRVASLTGSSGGNTAQQGLRSVLSFGADRKNLRVAAASPVGP
jgi:hypothetical protein